MSEQNNNKDQDQEGSEYESGSQYEDEESKQDQKSQRSQLNSAKSQSRTFKSQNPDIKTKPRASVQKKQKEEEIIIQGEYEIKKNKKKGVEVAIDLNKKCKQLEALAKETQASIPPCLSLVKQLQNEVQALDDNLSKQQKENNDFLAQRIKDITLKMFDEPLKNQLEINEDLKNQVKQLKLEDFVKIRNDINNVIQRTIAKEESVGHEDIYTDLVNSVVNF